MDRRNKILNLGCQYFSDLENLSEHGTLKEMLEFHTKIYNLDLPRKNESSKILYPAEKYPYLRYLTNEQTVSNHKDFLSCLPAKSGCSNYLMAFLWLFLKKQFCTNRKKKDCPKMFDGIFM